MSESLEIVPQEESNLQTVNEPHPTGNDEDQLSWTSYKDGSVLPAAFSMLEKIQENLLNGKCTFLQTEVSTG